MVSVTKRRDGDGIYGPRYRIFIDGQPTAFRVERSCRPKYRAVQMWDVYEGEDPQSVLFDTSSLEGALGVVWTISETARQTQKTPA